MHPRDGLIPPDQFIPLAEHTGLIKPLGLWAIKTALLQCRVWHQSGQNLTVAVNLSADSLHDLNMVDIIAQLLESSDSLPSWLTVEITESAMMVDPERARIALGRLHDMGVGISIDDFGTGYSSLSYLKDLPVDEVKIDRTFVKEMVTHEQNSCIVRSVIDLGHNLGLRVVAEGVEDLESVELLKALGCDLAQGFVFGRPLPPDQFLDWIEDTWKVPARTVPAGPRLPAGPS